MSAEEPVHLGPFTVGGDFPCLMVAELGQNHSGDLGTCLAMMQAAAAAGAQVVKTQKRDPDVCVPEAQKREVKETPWGAMGYVQYRWRLEFGKTQYDAIDAEARRLGIAWTASVWDLPSLAFLLHYDVPFIKIPSACLTDLELLEACRRSGRPVVASTGMSDEAQIARAVSMLGPDRLVLLHCTSTYPAAAKELNLRIIPWLRERFHVLIGFSDHSVGVWASLAAAVTGAVMIEKHLTLDRSAWGSDQSASCEPSGFARITRYIRQWEAARGDGIKRVWDSERPVMIRLRRIM